MTRKELIDYVRRSDPVLADESDDHIDKAIRALYPVAVMAARLARSNVRRSADESRSLRPSLVR